MLALLYLRKRSVDRLKAFSIDNAMCYNENSRSENYLDVLFHEDSNSETDSH